MYTNVKYASYDVTKVEGRESMKMKQDLETRDWKFKEIQVSPSPFKVWGRVNVLRDKKQVLARELQVFLVRPYPSLYPQPSDLQSYPHTHIMYLESIRIPNHLSSLHSDSHRDINTSLFDPISHLPTLLKPFNLWNSESEAKPTNPALLFSILFTQALCSSRKLLLS